MGQLGGAAPFGRCERRAPGDDHGQLDDVGAAFLRKHGARSAPQLTYDFPGFNCISVNDEIVHGVPGPRLLAAGDVVKIDVTAELDGLHRRFGDHAFSCRRSRPRGLRLVQLRALRVRPRPVSRRRAACGSPSWEGRSKTK